jgi:DNA-binding phage protein
VVFIHANSVARAAPFQEAKINQIFRAALSVEPAKPDCALLYFRDVEAEGSNPFTPTAFPRRPGLPVFGLTTSGEGGHFTLTASTPEGTLPMATSQQLDHGTAVVEFVAKVRQALKRKGWTITQLAKEAGVGRPYLHRVLSGEQEPSIKKASQIATPLGLTIRTVTNRKKSQE